MHNVFLFVSCLTEALNQGDSVDLDALMADLSSIEQELSSIGKPSSSSSRLGLPGDVKVRQKPPAGRSHSTKQAGGGGSSGGGSSSSSGGSASSSTRVSPASTVRMGGSGHSRPPLASNFSLDDITAQLERASLSMDEAARQSTASFISTASAPYASSTTRRPAHHHHRRTGSVGTVSEHEARAIVHSSRSSINSASASSMDSLDMEKPRPAEQDGLQEHSHPSTEVNSGTEYHHCPKKCPLNVTLQEKAETLFAVNVKSPFGPFLVLRPSSFTRCA